MRDRFYITEHGILRNGKMRIVFKGSGGLGMAHTLYVYRTTIVGLLDKYKVKSLVAYYVEAKIVYKIRVNRYLKVKVLKRMEEFDEIVP